MSYSYNAFTGMMTKKEPEKQQGSKNHQRTQPKDLFRNQKKQTFSKPIQDKKNQRTRSHEIISENILKSESDKPLLSQITTKNRQIQQVQNASSCSSDTVIMQEQQQPAKIKPERTSLLNNTVLKNRRQKQCEPKEEAKVEIEVNVKQELVPMVGPQFVLIGPPDLVIYRFVKQRLQEIYTNYSKSKVIEFIKLNLNRKKEKNVDNLLQLNDENFWLKIMPKIIQMVLSQGQLISSAICMLPSYMSESSVVTRKQIFLIIACMFLGILPQQTHTKHFFANFGELMTISQKELKFQHSRAPVRLQKLKCIVNYLKLMVDRKQLHNEEVIFQRVYNCDYGYTVESKENDTKKLKKVDIVKGKVEDYYGQAIVVDFANSIIGGGFMTNGSAQQEILFSIFPELIISKVLCQKMDRQEAIVVTGARRFNNYEGYSYNMKFNGTFDDKVLQYPQYSQIVAVDAEDYSKISNPLFQFSQSHVTRQIHKMMTGLKGISETTSKTFEKVSTGKWGCGVFKGNLILKFCIQWIACSEAEKQMIFNVQDEETKTELKMLVYNLKDMGVQELKAVINSFYQQKKVRKSGLNEGVTLLEYFKNFI